MLNNESIHVCMFCVGLNIYLTMWIVYLVCVPLDAACLAG